MNFSDNYNNLLDKVKNLKEYSYEELKAILHEAKDIEKEYENLQLVVKRNANSLYGVSASIFFSLVDFDIAEDITTVGKYFAKAVDKAINLFFVNWGDEELKVIQTLLPQVIKLRKFTEYKPYTKNDLCVYGDTDSRYINLGKIITTLMIIDYTETGKEIYMELPESDDLLSDIGCLIDKSFLVKVIKDTIDLECEKRNFRKGYLKMSHEVTTRKSIMQKKKKYILDQCWKDGKKLKPRKLKFQGVELKKGSSAPKLKKILGKLVEKFLTENYSTEQIRQECLKIIKYILSRKDKDLVYLITTVSGLKEIKKDETGIYKSSKNHIQHQIAVSWYNFIESNNLQQEYRKPFEGQKMNYYYCDERSGYKVMGVPDDVDITKVKNLPEPDWNKMIYQVFLKPLLRYISEKSEIDDIDIEHFILGVKQIKI